MNLPKPIKFFFKTMSKLVPVFSVQNKSILEVAHMNNIPLEGACEGSCACSTCHVILDKNLFNKLSTPSDKEYDLLDQAYGLTSTSRLGCQLFVDKRFKNSVIEIPKFTRNISVNEYIPKSH